MLTRFIPPFGISRILRFSSKKLLHRSGISFNLFRMSGSTGLCLGLGDLESLVAQMSSTCTVIAEPAARAANAPGPRRILAAITHTKRQVEVRFSLID